MVQMPATREKIQANQTELRSGTQLLSKTNKWKFQKKQEEQYEQELVFNSEEEEDYRDPETEDEKPQEGLIPMSTTRGAEALGCTPCDLTHESTGGVKPQLSTSMLLAKEDLATQWGSMAQGRKTEGVKTVIHVALVESSRVLVHSPILEQCNSVGTAYKECNQPI